VNDAAVLADGDVAEQFVLALEFLHLRHRIFRVVAAGGRHRIEIGERGGIDAGLVAARHLAVHARPCRKSLGERAGVLVHVPVKRFEQLQPLRDLQAHAVHVVDEQQKRHHGLAAGLDAEFASLLDRIDGVAAGIGEPDHLGLGVLRLQQQRGEIRGAERMLG